ncbi:T9SS type A sorting domain-containing protein [Neolewinella antarctica]|uniref:Secretion system C-terminal sorting domain-containing protein n=1 Tax=Neolewinella antarctica TaxID=442734 RepID=A0ABX0XDH7_9BACT|nr:T9SS type A sorting domain-containing protein [Neolewinella antarctica]NJC27356.1 hypothetical protein [Neolewinella antarctica]
MSRLRTRDGARTPLCATSAIDVSLNALAFNPNDQFLYAMTLFDDADFSGKFYRLGSDCEKLEIPVSGNVARYGDNSSATVNAGGGFIGSGTFDLDNNYYATTLFVGGSPDGSSNLIQKINVSGDAATVVSSQIMTCPACPANEPDFLIADIIFDENSGEIFGHNNATDSLYSINPADGVLTAVGASSVASPIVGIYKNRDGDVRAIGNNGTIYSVNVGTGAFTPLVNATDISGNNADAASGCYAPGTISGTLFVDANGLTDNTVNGTPAGTLPGSAGGAPVFVALIQGGVVLQSTQINADGTYTFTGDFDGTYEVRLTSTLATVGQASPAPSIPGEYQFVGDNVGTGPGNDGFPSGRVFPNVQDGANVADVNFGVDDKPTADDVREPIQVNPEGTDRVLVPALSVADTEDGTPTTIIIFNIPDPNFEGSLYYANIRITTNVRIRNFNPALFEFDPVDGFVSVVFSYVSEDAADVISDAATVTMEFSSATQTGQPTPFACSGNDGFGYFISSGPSVITGTELIIPSSRLSRIKTADGSRTGLCTASKIGVSLNALAFNPNDRFLYAVSRYDTTDFSGKFYRLGANCEKTAISVPGGTNGIKRYGTNDRSIVDGGGGAISSGTFDLDNNYYVNTSYALAGSTGFRNQIQKINLTGNSATVVSTQTLTCFGASCDGTNSLRITDIIFDEATNQLLGHNGVTNRFYVINDATGVITPLGPPSGVESVLGLYKNRDGDIRAIAADGGIYRVNITNGNFTFIIGAADLRTGNADAASGCYAPAILSGNVFADGNGRSDNRVSGTPINAVAGGQLYAILISRRGPLPVVVASQPVATDGTYAFEGDFDDGDYEIQIGLNPGTEGSAPPSQDLPDTHVFISEFIGFGTGVDTEAATDGRQTFTLVDAESLINIDFGINTKPLASSVTATYENPGGVNRVEVPDLSRTDAEDGVPNIVRINSVPNSTTQGVLFYDGVAITGVENITDFDPALLTVDPIDGDVTVTFTYEARDSALTFSGERTVNMVFTSATLPIDLVYFAGEYEGSGVSLSWRTASERNTDYFIVERSSTGTEFAEVGRVAATGNSSALRDYGLVDPQPLRIAYYRLKDVDFDGTFSYSNVINLSREDWVQVDVYPSPVTDELTVAYDASQASQLHVSFYNVSGQRLLSRTLENGARQIDVAALPAGFYSVVITNGDTGRVTTKKVVKK